MKIFNNEKINKLIAYQRYFQVFKIVRIFLLPFAFLIRSTRRQRPKYLISDGFLIGDTVMLRPFLKAALKKTDLVYFMGGAHSSVILSDIPIKIIVNQWPWATYNYGFINLLKQLGIFFQILFLQPEVIIETRGDFRSILFLYLTCPEKFAGYSFSGGRSFLDIEPDNSGNIFHLEQHNKLLAEALHLDYDSKDIQFLKKATLRGNLIGLSFSGSQILKTLPRGVAMEILGILKTKFFRLVYLSSPKDHFLTVEKNTKNLKTLGIEIWNGSFTEYFRFMQSLNGYIGMDSGGGHIAAMFGIPSLIVFGTQEPYYCKPVGNEYLVTMETQEKLICRPCNGTNCSNRIFQKCLNGITKNQIEIAMKAFFAKIELQAKRKEIEIVDFHLKMPDVIDMESLRQV